MKGSHAKIIGFLFGRALRAGLSALALPGHGAAGRRSGRASIPRANAAPQHRSILPIHTIGLFVSCYAVGWSIFPERAGAGSATPPYLVGYY